MLSIRLRPLICFLAMVISLGVGILWVRSYVVGGYWQWFVISPSHARLFGASWGRGSVDFFYNHLDPLPEELIGKKSEFTFKSKPETDADDNAANYSYSPTGFIWLQRLGFVYRKSEYPGAQFHTFTMPFWALTALPLIVPTPVLRRWRRRRTRRSRGQCLNCGYDLRASGTCCPECGTPILADAPEMRGRAKGVTAIVITSVVVGALCSYGGDVSGRRDVARADDAARTAEDARNASERINVPPRADQAAWQREHAAIESTRRNVLSLDYVRLSQRTPESTGMGPNARLWSEMEFQLTNRSTRAIDGTGGVIELYGPDHRLLGSVGSNVGLPLDAGLWCRGGSVCALDEATRSALTDGKVTADYRAAYVRYPDKTITTFGEGLWPDAFLSTVSAVAK